jgi:repressor LexA
MIIGPDDLHEHEKKILRFLERYWQKYCNSPSYKDIMVAVGLRSKDHVSRDLDMLEEKGYIRRRDRQARSIRLLRTLSGLEFSPFQKPADRSFLQVSLVGTIAAGTPIHWPGSDFDPYDHEIINLATEFVGKDQVYALKVRGDSMVDAMINDGDIVIMEPKTDVDVNGEIVAVWLKDDEETTLKRFYDEGDRIRLQPCNPSMEPIYVERDKVRIQGRVVTVIRSVHDVTAPLPIG